MAKINELNKCIWLLDFQLLCSSSFEIRIKGFQYFGQVQIVTNILHKGDSLSFILLFILLENGKKCIVL